MVGGDGRTCGWPGHSESHTAALGVPIPLAVRLHIGLAFVSFVGAGVLGVLIGADRDFDVVPGFAITNVYAHAHLAGLGWATLMVIGVGYRLLPMVLPSAMPEGPRVIASLVLVQLGVVGLFGRFWLPGMPDLFGP